MTWVKPGHDTVPTFVRAALARWDWRPRTPQSGARWLDGQVRLLGVADCPPCAARYQVEADELTDPRHPVLEHADRILRRWPEARTEAAILLDEIQSWIPKGAGFTMEALGSSSGLGDGWGRIVVMAGNPVGYAEGVLHALARQKLSAIGIDAEEHDVAVILNRPDELHEISMRPDKPIPMSAVLHSYYASLHVVEIELRALRGGYDCAAALRIQTARLIEADAIVRHHARWAFGAGAIRDALHLWTDDLLQQYDDRVGGLES